MQTRSRQPSAKALAAKEQADAAAALLTAPKRGPGRPRKNPVISEAPAGGKKPTKRGGKSGRGGKAGRRGGRTGSSAKEPPPPYVAQTENSDREINDSDDFNLDEVDDDFDAEPTDDFFVGALKSGVENGTIILSDGEDPLGDDDDNDFNPRGEEDENDVDFFDEDEEFDDDPKPSGPVTSTPFVRKKAAPKGKKKAPAKATAATRKSAARTVEEQDEEEDDPFMVYEAKINVHDGAALRQVKINSKESLLDVLSKVAAAMLRLNNEVEMSCEAPWSTKMGSKKIPQYITNAIELEEFWVNFKRRVKKTKTMDIPGILFRNMRDNNPKPKAKKAKEAPCREEAGGETVDPRNSAKAKIEEATTAIQIGMRCKREHSTRLCYLKYDGSCGAYTHEHVLEHATLLAGNTADVVADKVPAQLSSKLLDYFRPGKDSRQKNRPDDRELESASNVAAPAPVAPAPVAVAPVAVAVAPPAVKSGPFNFPTIKTWLLFCEEHLERGRDKHDYAALLPVFTVNGCTRVDDVARLSCELLMSLAAKEGLELTIGLANRVVDYAVHDVARLKKGKKLTDDEE
ncbi:hypothetical protein SCHPADRAFT_896620 [Schizopora paradoxa]|uniref:Uncharacterized protein n=1 Tax=Schizopora paradoxa TaxID=27342 RepID=A0A0H2R139_9AGAM|nr:hypothetical protein SCHPADRAFT_896620 [Schizopora paradoxa]